MARIGQAQGKIGEYHVRIVHDCSVGDAGAVRGNYALGCEGDAQYLVRLVAVLQNKFLNFSCNLFIVIVCAAVGKREGGGRQLLAVQIDSYDMKHVFQETDSDSNLHIRDDADDLCFASACGLEISVSLDQPLLLQHIQVLADSGQPHLQVLHNLLLGGLPFPINVLIDIFLVYFL